MKKVILVVSVISVISMIFALQDKNANADSSGNRYACFNWKKSKMYEIDYNQYRLCSTNPNIPNGYTKGPQYCDKNGGKYWYGFQSKSVINLQDCQMFDWGHYIDRKCSQKDNLGAEWSKKAVFRKPDSGPTYYNFKITNYGRCERYCRKNPKCMKCSTLPGCGFGYKSIKKFNNSEGKNYYACEKR